MREIKFRCWQVDEYEDGDDDKPIWKMIPAEDLAFEKYEPLVDLLRSDPETEIFMQYTGLKDKNGEEIYQGDILYSGTTTLKKKRLLYEVYYFAPIFNIRSVGNRKSQTVTSTSKYFWRRCEVVGNIYEHPHLLNSEQNLQRSVASKVDSKTNDEKQNIKM